MDKQGDPFQITNKSQKSIGGEVRNMGATSTGITGRFFSQGVTPERTPGFLGINDAADPSSRMCLAGDTQGPIGTTGDKSTVESSRPEDRLTCSALVFDFDELVRLFKHTASAIAIDNLTKVQWDGLLKTVQTGTAAEIQNQTSVLAGQFMEEFTTQTGLGGAEACAYLEQLAKRKETATESTKTKFADALANNLAQVEFAKGMVKGLSAVKFGSTVILKTAGLFTGIGGFLVDLGYEVAIKLVESQDDAAGATVVAVVQKEVAEEIQEEGTEKSAEAWKNHVTKLDDQLTKHQRQLKDNRLSSKKRRGVTKRYSRLEAQGNKLAGKASKVGALAKRAKVIGPAGKLVGIAFWAKNVNEAWVELVETWAEADR